MIDPHSDLIGRLTAMERMLSFLLAAHVSGHSAEQIAGLYESFQSQFPPLGAGIMDAERLGEIHLAMHECETRIFELALATIAENKSPAG